MKNAYKWEIDTLPKALVVIDAMRLLLMNSEGAKKALEYLLSEYPEIRQCTHEYIADHILGCSREAITRTGLLRRAGGKT